ncbi:DUF397 domain-containing protein [Actinomadura sp. WMMA1423]|uniref:DUF397 domain-containing protein n=1 Tax=Actinomadura sp. WMMA1423 TaxID=2591108 RepID=UPI00114763D2|nr:DUF397 domain-containing protein [Actinomadura sp. WMMA1423]
MELNGLVWRKPSRSNESGDACVEFASASGVVMVRDGKDPDGARLVVSRAGFRSLVRS